MILLEIMDSILYLSIAMLISMGIITTIFAQLTSLDLTAPTTITELYGGDKKGILDLNIQNNVVILMPQ